LVCQFNFKDKLTKINTQKSAKSIDTIINAYYWVVFWLRVADSWELKEIKYIHFKKCCITRIRTEKMKKLNRIPLKRKSIPTIILKEDFLNEKELKRVKSKYGSIAQVLRALNYELIQEPNPNIRGLNSNSTTFMKNGRWWIRQLDLWNGKSEKSSVVTEFMNK